MKKAIVIGQTGQLAQALNRNFNPEVLDLHFLNRSDCDLSGSKEQIDTALEACPVSDAVIIVAAYTNVDLAESEQDLAHAVNAQAPGYIAEWCAARQIPTIYISTDYVFSGESSEPYTHDHEVDPINSYGVTKRAGEVAVSNANPRSAIVRTSWVFDGNGKNFLTTMLRLAETRTELGVVDDQTGRPTYAGHLADAVLELTKLLIADEEAPTGVFNVTGSGTPITWATFARRIFTEAFLPDEKHIEVASITSDAFPTVAKRPTYSVLDLTRFEMATNKALPDWREGLKLALSEHRSGPEGK